MRRASLAIGIFVIGCLIGAAACLPAIGAGALLHPARHALTVATPAGCEDVAFAGEGVTLGGWRCRASTPARATIVYLHGISDNRGSAAGIIRRYTARGFDVIAYDSRAHGASDGSVCTYGYYEKQDLRRVIDTIARPPIILMGTSLGAAVALQEAADDRRIAAIVAAETFSDLRTVASQRAPRIFTQHTVERAFTRAEAEGRFSVDAVSPAAAAARITAPVLLIHGANDVDTPPAHSERVRAALHVPSRLLLVPGAGHNQSLRGDVWPEIDRWIDEFVR